MENKCLNCNNTLLENKKNYCSPECLRRHQNKKYQSYERQNQKGTQTKLYYLRKLGAECSICKYATNMSALCFHHIDPSIKEFELDSRGFANRTINILENEIKKCIILCHNCHSELHNPQLDMKNFINVEATLDFKSQSAIYKLNNFSSEEIENLVNDINNSCITNVSENLHTTIKTLKGFLKSKNILDKIYIESRKPQKQNKSRDKINWPTDLDLLKLYNETKNFRYVANQLGVTDNAVRKRLKKRGLI